MWRFLDENKMNRWLSRNSGSIVNSCIALSVAVSPYSLSQTAIIRDVDIIYGDEVVRGQHQIIVASPAEVAVVPAEKKKEFTLGPNVVVGDDSSGQFYLEESDVAEREQKIYREVNRRTKDAPFTVLFTGNIPPEIQAKRFQLMPEIGVFGDQLDKLNKDRAGNQTGEEETAKDAFIPENIPGVQIFGSDENDPAKEGADAQSEDELLEKLIGG